MRTRRRILLAAAQVFDRKGFAAATLQEILAECGLTKGSLYFHFRSKEELAHAIVIADSSAASILDTVGNRPVQDVIDATHWLARALQFDPMLRASFRMAVEYGTFVRPDIFTTYGLWSAKLVRMLEQAQDAGQLRFGLQASSAKDFILASFVGLQIVSQVASERRDLPDRLELWWRLALPGLVPAQQVRSYQPASKAMRPPGSPPQGA